MNNSIEDFITITNNGLDVDANNVNANCITSKNNTFSMDTSGNLICNSITTNLPSLLTFDQIYPVGSIYMSTVNTNPSTLFGGSWTKIEGRFLLSSSNTYSAGSTGGEESVTLSVNELPNHNHNVYPYYGGVGNGNALQRGYSTTTTSISYQTSSVGGNQPHNNMPPYLVVHMWKRVS